MIESKETLVGTLNTAIEYVQPVTQEKEVTPKKEMQEVTPDNGYTGLSKVTVDPIPNEYVIPNGIVDINSNGVSNVSGYASANVNVKPTLQSKNVTPSKETQNITFDENYEGLSNVIVEPISEEYTKPTGTLDITTNGIHDVKDYERANVNVELPKITNASYLFDSNARTDYMNEFVSMITPDCIDFTRSFNNIKMKPPYFDTSNGQLFSTAFGNNSYLTELPAYDFSNATTCSSMCSTCLNLKVVPLLNLGKCTSVSSMFSRCQSLETLGGFKDLGKAYLTTNSANYSSYKFDLSASTKITYESLMNVINNLYDIASIGVKAQQLVLGSTNLAKLNSDEIAIATNKGWVVS